MYNEFMKWLNYHHLYYFWCVVREGTIARAGVRLHLTQPTISGQLRSLERAVGAKLFVRAGRNLALTDTGRTVFPAVKVEKYDGVKVGFIGMTLENTPNIVTKSGVEGLKFSDEV